MKAKISFNPVQASGPDLDLDLDLDPTLSGTYVEWDLELDNKINRIDWPKFTEVREALI